MVRKTLTIHEREALDTVVLAEGNGKWKGFDADDLKMIDSKAVTSLCRKRMIKYNKSWHSYQSTPRGKKVHKLVENKGYY